MADLFEVFILLIVYIIFMVGIYLLSAYCMFRLGRKFGIGNLWGYMVPFYNVYLIHQCSRLPTTYLLILLIPFVGPMIWSVMAYGEIAKRLGKDYWLYGLGTALIGIPFFIMAFDSSMPQDSSVVRFMGAPHQLEVTPPIQRMSYQKDPRFTGSTAFLVGTGGTYQGAVIPIPTEGVVIGRDANLANIIISDDSVSKSHVKLSLHPSRFDTVLIQDMGSTHGTFLQDGDYGAWSPLSGIHQLTAGSNAMVRIGSSHEIFEIKFEI